VLLHGSRQVRSWLIFDVSQIMKPLAVLAFIFGIASTLAAQSRFVRVQLPLGASVEVPQNWWLLSGDINTTIEAAGEAAVKLAGIDVAPGKKVNLFRANSMPRTTYAAIAVNATDTEFPPEVIRDATKVELKELEEAMAEMMKKTIAVQNLQFLGSLSFERKLISGHVSTVWRYRRSGPNGPVTVVMHRLYVRKKEISFNLSYREAEAALWKPVTEYMSQSIRVEKKG
jgi:hypothetical protein